MKNRPMRMNAPDGPSVGNPPHVSKLPRNQGKMQMTHVLNHTPMTWLATVVEIVVGLRGGCSNSQAEWMMTFMTLPPTVELEVVR